MIVIGVSGPYASGKGEVMKVLEQCGFVCLSLSDALREELRTRHLPESREQMIELGNELRGRYGPSVLADRIVQRVSRERNYAIDSIRNPEEVRALRNGPGGFTLVWVEAPENVRFKRLRCRARRGDPETIEEMQELEGRERDGRIPANQQLGRVREMADVVISNSGSLEELHEKVRTVLKRSQFFERPSWDEYFMNIAYVVASRSNCVKRRVASVLTKDQRIISTGYNGTPRGVRNCNEGGCPRCNEFFSSGQRLDLCYCSHGEENAINQAAYHGVSVRGATLYTTLSPCLGCTKMIINAGVAAVIYNAAYSLDETSLNLLREAGVQVRRLTVHPASGVSVSRLD